jgi:AcrR family transcriptional regulator
MSARSTKRISPSRLAKEHVRTPSLPRDNRLTRSRLRTRQKLIEAALIVMGRKGVGAATIADITEQADVGFGSFYNHFKSKEQIAHEVFVLRAEEFARELEGVFERIEDPALAVSVVQRWFVERGRRDPVWGWFIIHVDAALEVVEKTFRTRILNDLQRFTASGRFKVPALDTAATITLAAIMSTMRRQLEGKGSESAASEMVEALMRMYGLEHDEAHKVAREPLPTWLGSNI